MKKIQTLYNLLGVSSKVQDTQKRYLYLKDVWGLEQNDIAEIERVSQSQVSKVLIQARKNDVELPYVEFSSDEIKYIHYLPRDIINDSQLLAFVSNLLGYNVDHQFFQFAIKNDGIRIAALSSLGVQNKRLQQLFGKAQSSISMSIQRSMKRAMEIQNPSRYTDALRVYPVAPREPKKVVKSKFTLAGGQE